MKQLRPAAAGSAQDRDASAPSAGQTADKPETILVYVGLDLVGDALIKLPVLRALRKAFPDARITWLAGKGKTAYAHQLKPLAAGLIDEVIEEADIGRRWSEILGRPLANRRFDLILDTQRRLVTSLVLRRIRHRRFVSGCARYLLSSVRPPPMRWLFYRKPPAMVDQMLELVALAHAGALDAPLDIGGAPSLPEPVRREAARRLPEGPAYVAMAPGAGDRSKCWPLERFVELGRRLASGGLVPVYVLGPEEAEWLEPLRHAVPGARVPLQDGAPAGETGPLLTMALGARCRVCVANDSGGGHMLAASGTPLVSLFGPTSPAKFAPRVPRLTVIEAARFGSRDMTAIPVEAVEAAIAAALER